MRKFTHKWRFHMVKWTDHQFENCFFFPLHFEWPHLKKKNPYHSGTPYHSKEFNSQNAAGITHWVCLTLTYPNLLTFRITFQLACHMRKSHRRTCNWSCNCKAYELSSHVLAVHLAPFPIPKLTAKPWPKCALPHAPTRILPPALLT
jgi:hypothetical protein